MVDPVGAGLGAAALLQASITLISRVSTAIELQKNTVSDLKPISDDLFGVREALYFISGRPELQTHGVESSIRPIHEVARTLGNHVEQMNAKARKFAHQFFKGGEERNKLNELIIHLVALKTTLTLNICLAGIDVFKVKQEETTGATVLVINYTVLQKVSQDVSKSFGQELYVVGALRDLGKKPDANGMVPLTQEEYRRICEVQSPVAEKVQQAQQKIRINVKDNESYDFSIQINTLMGDVRKSWEQHIGELNIVGNTSYDLSTQVNFPVTQEQGDEIIKQHHERVKALATPDAISQMLSRPRASRRPMP